MDNLKARSNPKIKVVVRKRPISEKEIEKSDMDIIEKRNLTNIVIK